MIRKHNHKYEVLCSMGQGTLKPSSKTSYSFSENKGCIQSSMGWYRIKIGSYTVTVKGSSVPLKENTENLK